MLMWPTYPRDPEFNDRLTDQSLTNEYLTDES